MGIQAGVSTQTLTAALPRRQHAARTVPLPTLSPSTTPDQVPDLQVEPQPRPSHDGSVYCDAVQHQESDDDSDTETHGPREPCAGSAATPATSITDDVWNFNVPVPGSKNKLVFYKAPFEWGQWTKEQWHERFVFVKEQLETLVYIHLRLMDESQPVYSPRMVGTCPSDARPSVLVTCRDVDFKNIRNLFHARAAQPLLLGRESTMSQLWSVFGHRTETFEPKFPRLPLVYYRTRTLPLTRSALEKPLLVSLAADGVLCGGIIRYGERSATLGVALDLGNSIGILTVDHLFPSEKTSKLSSPLDNEPLFSAGSSPPMSAEHEEVDEEVDVNDLWEDDGDDYEDLDTDDGLDSPTTEPAEAHETHLISAASEKWQKLAPTTQLTPWDAYLDWALTCPASTTSATSLPRVNTVFPGGPQSKGIVLETFQQSPPDHLAPVYLVSGIRGILHGQIMAVSSFLPSFPGPKSCEVWTVIISASKGGIQSGECGSVVVDSATHKVYGHVVGSDPLGHAHVVPLAHILNQVTVCFGGFGVTPRLAVPDGLPVSAKAPATVAKQNASETPSNQLTLSRMHHDSDEKSAWITRSRAFRLPRGRWGAWSNWEWDAAQARWWRVRYDPQGNVEYGFERSGKAPDLSGKSKLRDQSHPTKDQGSFSREYKHNTRKDYPDDLRDNPAAGQASQGQHYGRPSRPLDPTALDSAVSALTELPSDPFFSAPSPRAPTGDDPVASEAASTNPIYGATPQDALYAADDPYGSETDDEDNTVPHHESETDYKDQTSVSAGFGSSGEPDEYDGYVVEPSSRFRPGEVFNIKWVDPLGSAHSRSDSRSEVITNDEHLRHSGKQFFQGIRRFIILANDEGHCTCVPILTYEHMACTKRGVKPLKHGIVYQAGKKPRLLENEPKLGFRPIEVDLYERTERLDRESRVNYAKITTIEHSCRVFMIGRVDPHDFANIVVPAVDHCWARKHGKSTDSGSDPVPARQTGKGGDRQPHT